MYSNTLFSIYEYGIFLIILDLKEYNTMANVGYIRVSTIDQNTARQLDSLQLDKVFTEHKSGKNKDREQLKALIDYVRDGDTVHVHSIDRSACNLADLKELVSLLNDKGVSVHFHKEGMKFNGDKSDLMTNLLFNILGSFAEFEREAYARTSERRNCKS